jgi:hypothetical protein
MSRRIWIVIGGLAILALPVAWYLISPLFIDEKVDEAFPTLAVEATETMVAAAAEPDQEMDEVMPVEDPASMSWGMGRGFFVSRTLRSLTVPSCMYGSFRQIRYLIPLDAKFRITLMLGL